MGISHFWAIGYKPDGCSGGRGAAIPPVQHARGNVTAIVLFQFCFKPVEPPQLLAVTRCYGYAQITVN